MWPVLLNMSPDDCRRTLRRLELEAYAKMISVFRAQGALEDNRRKLLEDLREALHIGSDRHSAEARRAANDELLATIAEQLSGPNTGLGWISEGRRRIPLMPRGVPQTAYTELADQVARQVIAENEELKLKQEAQLSEAESIIEEIEITEEGKEEESALEHTINLNDETLYPPIVMEDQTFKVNSHASSTPIKNNPVGGQPCQFIIKKKGNLSFDKTPQKVQMSDIKILKKPTEGIKVLPKKPIVVAPNAIHKVVSGPGRVVQNKINPTKIISALHTPNMDKMVVVSGSNKTVQKTIGNPKNIILTQSSAATPISKGNVTIDSNIISPKIADDSTPKGIAANDVKVSAKTFLLNPKSGQKMVVLPAKTKSKLNASQAIPVVQFKNMSTTMKLVPVSKSVNQVSKTNTNITIVRSSASSISTPVTTKVVSADMGRTPDSANKPVQGLRIGAQVSTGMPVLRQNTGKGIIVVQKGTPLGKPLMSKVVMGKNVNKLIQAQGDQISSSNKKSSNVILLDLNEQLNATTMSKILDSHTANATQAEASKENNIRTITEETPVYFDTEIVEETCNANSLDSLSTVDMGHLEDGSISSIEKQEKSSIEQKEIESAKDTSSVTDWEMELDTVGRKDKADSGSSLHLELCMSSDSETDGYLVKTEKPKKQQTEEVVSATEDANELFGERSGLSLASRTLLSQLQDDGSSSNDSSFALNKTKHSDKTKQMPSVSDKDANKDKSEPIKSQVKRLDMFGAADLAAFGYLESDEGMMSGEDMFGDGDSDAAKSGTRSGKETSLDLQLSQLLADNADTNNVGLPLSK